MFARPTDKELTMKFTKILAILPLTTAMALLFNFEPQNAAPGTQNAAVGNIGKIFSVATAEAGPVVRSARRTSRRVTRRHAYYYSLPAGCVTRVVGGVRYSYCGGVYYKRTTVSSGRTAYVIVNP